MRRILGVCLLSICPLAVAQNAPADNATLTALMSEVHELRLAMERSTLLGAKTQVAIQRMQTQEQRLAKSSEALESARTELGQIQAEKVQMGALLKDLEARLTRTTAPEARRSLEERIQDVKRMTPDATREGLIRGREAEAFSQFQNEQAQFARMQSEMAQFESALDSAIQQLAPRR